MAEQRRQTGEIPARIEPGEVALYRFYSQERELLYVGISTQPIKRWYAHTQKDWWPRAAAYEIEWYSSLTAAEEAEKAAIVADKPVENRVHNKVPYRNRRFPAMRLPELVEAHFHDRPFTLYDLEEELGIPYGTAITYVARLVAEGVFEDRGTIVVTARTRKSTRRLFAMKRAAEQPPTE